MGDGRGEASAGGSFGDALRAVRVRMNLSQGQVAQRVGLDRSYVNRLEAGERGAPSAQVIVAMATALDLDESDTDHLLLAGGLPVKALVELGLDDPTLLALARRLADARVPEANRAALRSTIDAILAHWEGIPAPAVGPAATSAGAARRPGPAGRGARGEARP